MTLFTDSVYVHRPVADSEIPRRAVAPDGTGGTSEPRFEPIAPPRPTRMRDKPQPLTAPARSKTHIDLMPFFFLVLLAWVTISYILDTPERRAEINIALSGAID